jgi:hypothetical protein
MFVIVFNESNIVQDGQNNKLVYRFPNSTILTNKYISISNISMFYSWFNISQANSNNTFTYTWTAGTTTTTYTILIPDGLYEIPEINYFAQFQFINNGTYWIDTLTGQYAYPFEIILNATRYAIQLNTYLIPVALPANASIPPNFPGWPSVQQNSVITFPAKFNKIVGYFAGFASNANLNNAFIPPLPASKTTNYVEKSANGILGTLSYLSNFAPQVQPNNNVLFSLSNINNPYSQPSSIIFSLNPKVAVGQQITESPPTFMWNKMIDGTYTELRLSLLGTDLQPLQINDPNMTILMTIRDEDEKA